MSETSKAYAVAIQHGGRIVRVFTCQQDAYNEAASLAEQGEGDFSVFPMVHEPRWIPVTERLPDTPNMVLAYSGGIIECAWCNRGIWSWIAMLGHFEPTHWMPLPEPPSNS